MTYTYTLSGNFTAEVVTDITASGETYELPDRGSRKPSQQWIGSAYLVTSEEKGEEKGLIVLFKFDNNDSGQLDVYALPFTRFGEGRMKKGDNYLPEHLHHPAKRISGTTAIFDINMSGITSSGMAIIRQ